METPQVKAIAVTVDWAWRSRKSNVVLVLVLVGVAFYSTTQMQVGVVVCMLVMSALAECGAVGGWGVCGNGNAQ